MFGHRNDGKKVKGLNIIDKAEPFFMPQRIDAVNYTAIKVPCDKLDEFIQREKRSGNSYSYMHIAIAIIVRLLYTRQKLNRFIMRGSIYQRNYISVSMDIKKKLEDDGEQVTLKFMFTGRESLEDVKAIIDKEIAENIKEESEYTTTKAIKKYTKLPDFMIRWAIAMFRWLDKHGMLPKSLVKASPFHTSCFFTNLKSIKLGYIYHHLYNFGTTTIFVAMGKEKMEPYVENNKELKIGKFLTFGISLDERVADGLYMGKSLKLLQDLLANPDSLKERLPEDGTIPKKLIKKKTKKVKIKKSKKDKKPKKIKPLKNKQKHDEKKKKSALKKLLKKEKENTVVSTAEIQEENTNVKNEQE